MTWESLVKSLNSPVGKRLDRIAKQAVKGAVLRMVVPYVVPFGGVSISALDHSSDLVGEIAHEILNQVNENNNV